MGDLFLGLGVDTRSDSSSHLSVRSRSNSELLLLLRSEIILPESESRQGTLAEVFADQDLMFTILIMRKKLQNF